MADEKNSKDPSEEDTAKADAEAPETSNADPLKVPKAEVPGTVEEDAAQESETSGTSSDETVSVEEPDQTATETRPPDATANGDDSGDVTPEPANDAVPETEGASVVEAQPDAAPDSGIATPVPPEVVRETVVENKGGVGSMLIGGALAAGIGFLAAQFQSGDWPFGSGTAQDDPFRTQTEAALASQQGSVDSLSERLGTVESAIASVDDSATQAALTGLQEQVAELNDQAALWTDQIGLLEVRVVALEKAPIAETVSPEAIAAYERELEALRADITAQRAEIENMATEAVAAEQNAAAQAELAKARAALAELTAALENGRPFDQSVIIIEAADGISVPEALSATATEGVPTLTGLADSFPAAARAALAAARNSGTEGEGSRLTGFLKAQLGARSVAPKDGDDPDAVLSRAEAAITAGDLTTVLSEVSSLPDDAKAAMSDWIARAERRAEAQAAADMLTQELNKQ